MVLVRVFYGLSLYIVLNHSSAWDTLLEVEDVDPQWPAAWLDATGLSTGVPLILGGYAIATCIVLLAPQWRIARIAYSLTLLQFMALDNGFGKINHFFHVWLFVSVVFILLPDRGWDQGRPVREQRYFVTVVWTAQLWLLFTYTLTGLWKLQDAVVALFNDRTSAFEIDAFAYIAADRISATNQDPLLGDFFVRNEVLGWMAFLLTIFVETASFAIAFRPRLHRLWGVMLILFHLGIYFVLDFTFQLNVLLLVVLMVASPFVPDRIGWRDAVTDVPGIHVLVGLVRRVRRVRPNAQVDVAVR